MGYEEVKEKMEEVHLDLKGAYLSGVPSVDATLFVFMADGKMRILNVEAMSATLHKEPGVIIEGLKARLKAEESILGVMFVGECWAAKLDIKDEDKKGEPDDVVKRHMDNGGKRPSECENREEILMITSELRNGDGWYYSHKILRDQAGMPSLEVSTDPIEAGDMSGRLLGVFK